MILSDTKKRVNKQDKSSLLVGILLLCLVVFLSINFFVAKEKEANDKPVGIFCSAETIKDGFFVKNDEKQSKKIWQFVCRAKFRRRIDFC